ncbi:hypothetical protein [Calothrix sp. PCC 6303]|uniref:hypothetical protein n=1 Tax=Calothrix sp. PCC 6303 TaxID=1170562 RepID=UPI0002A03260|nr:hypothetical protein [Calothrix sp. PCC 6303]AFZ03351.1 hypothetical protein Cal6303_4448 [Calothrix sp. PCC 6303]
MFWKLVISALVLPASIGLSSATAEASTNTEVSLLGETQNHTSQNLGVVEESPQLIATYYKKCSYQHRRHHGGHHQNRYRHNGGHRKHHGGHHQNRYRHNGGHGGHGGHHNNNYGGGHHNNNYQNQGYYNNY